MVTDYLTELANGNITGESVKAAVDSYTQSDVVSALIIGYRHLAKQSNDEKTILNCRTLANYLFAGGKVRIGETDVGLNLNEKFITITDKGLGRG